MTGHPQSTKADGFSLVELVMGVAVFVTAAVVLGGHITTNYQTTATQRDKVFAFTKAQAILSEVHAFVDRGDVEAAIDLDVLDDGAVWKPVMTVAKDSKGNQMPADHPLSGNTLRDKEWVWGRKISVRPFAGLNNRTVRYVTVRIGKRDKNNVMHELASLSSVVNSVGSAFPSTQVFDVYLLAIENIPGWWVYMEAIVPFLESAITDLENRNPGLSVRTHWITKAGFGRNRAYKPDINTDIDSNQTVDDVYFYPGLMPAGSASTYYYVPDLMKGRMSADGRLMNGYHPDTNPYPYALADFYNHAMRYPQAKAYHDLRVAAIDKRLEEIRDANRLGVVPPEELDDMSPEPPLQVLLEDMASNPDRFRHALLINLHGELFPTPAIRNYSDPAKDPNRLPYVRVVTHPEELRTAAPGDPSGGDDVKLRVYAYTTDPTNYASLGFSETMPSHHPIVVQVMDMDLTDGTGSGLVDPAVNVEAIRGGVDEGLGTRQDYSRGKGATWWDVRTAPFQPTYSAWFVDPGYGERKYTMFLFHHTPVVAPEMSGKGLPNTDQTRLYGLEYVPGSPGGFDFPRTLETDGWMTKNTARWIITIPDDFWAGRRFVDTTSKYYDPRDLGEEDFMLTVRTRIWDPWLPDPMLSGMWPEGDRPYIIAPDNISETYTWWADSREDVPVTERGQVWGDPRHNPYRDLLTGDPDFGDGYNWFHDSLTNNSQNGKTDYPGIVRTWNKWNGGPRFDIPRVFETVRAALVESQSIYTTLSGYSYYYVGCGNEIGYDSANGYRNSIPCNRQPWGGGPTDTGYTNNITSRRCFIRNSGASVDWWGMPWLGELYPDWAYATDWFATDADGILRGNLTAGTLSNEFHRRSERDCYAAGRHKGWGTYMHNSHHRTSSRGCVSFFNIGTGSSHFNHHFKSGNGYLTGSGVELATNYGFPMPNAATITRPFSVNTGGNVPSEYNYAPYNVERYSGSILRTYYNHGSGYTGSGLVQVENPDQDSAGWIIVNGLAQTTTTGSAFLAKFCLLSMFQSYFELGDKTLTHRIKQPPRVEIVSPTEITELVDPDYIDVQWDTEWLRWDRLPYTTNTPVSFAEDPSLVDYVVLYSPDVGQTWFHVQDNAPAILGKKPTNPLHIIKDQNPSTENYRWKTPRSLFPEGSYLVRIETYRDDMALHYSVHQVKVFIER